MSAKIIDGKAVAKKLREEIALETRALTEKGVKPGLAVILVGDDPASRVYVNNKEKDCAECGIYSEEHKLPETTTYETLSGLIKELNYRSDIHGILMQLPLPKHLASDDLLGDIDPKKDVDAFHPFNTGRIMIGDYDFLPCTPAGVMALLDEYNIQISGKRCVVVGRSNIVGKPQAMLLLHRDATVSICHSRTPDLAEYTRSADILVSAAGRVGLISSHMVKPGAVVIDVAMNRDMNGNLCGDVNFDEVREIASYITPVPGGVGPMTRVMLLKNTITAAKRAGGLK